MNGDMMSKVIIKIIASMSFVFATLMVPSGGQAADSSWSTGIGFEFSSGKYRTDTRTDTIFIPFTVSYYPTERLDLFLEIPYIYQSSGVVTAGVYSGMQGQSGMMASSVALMSAGSGMGASSTSSVPASSAKSARNGIGDITLKSGYIVVPEKGPIPQVRPNAYIKFPTADRDKALGTGEFDGGLAVEVSKWFGKWYAYGETGYTIQGKTAALLLKNYLYYSGGAGYQVNVHFRPILLLKGSTAPAEGSTALLEARLKLKYQFTRNTGLDGYLAKGITASSPDYGAGLAVIYDF
jgi:hypothetical protein